MANTRDLRRRIKSVKNTAQITRAMQMVSATKMKKAQSRALSGRPYGDTLFEVLALVSKSEEALSHPLLQKNSSSKVAILFLSTDKGLCGALNTNLFRKIVHSEIFSSKDSDLIFYTVGRKGREFIVRTTKNLEADFENLENVSFEEAFKIRNFLLNAFLNQEVGEVYLLYPRFISTLRQEADLLKILPIDSQAERKIKVEELADHKQQTNDSSEFVFEPNKPEILDFALKHLLDVSIYQALLETKASEHSARMIAMQNATNNAKDLVEDLTLTYNQARQENITKEILEITTAGLALE